MLTLHLLGCKAEHRGGDAALSAALLLPAVADSSEQNLQEGTHMDDTHATSEAERLQKKIMWIASFA
jgi:hypothetical protein